MRALLGTGEIGDGNALSVYDGVQTEIAPSRAYSPVNPICIGSVLPADPMPALSRTCEADVIGLPLVSGAYYPMTPHQRLFMWPDTGVGPVRYDMGRWGVSYPPKEVPMGQTDWPTAPVTLVTIYDDEHKGAPSLNSAFVTEPTTLPQRGNSLREFWTFRQTMSWTNIFPRPMLFPSTTRIFKISGVVRDNVGSPLGGVTLRLIMSSMFSAGLPGNPIMAELITDGSGVYSFGVHPLLGYEIHAYHEGTNVGGITVDDLIADVTTDIYCTQPGVAPPVGGGSNTYSRGRVVNA